MADNFEQDNTGSKNGATSKDYATLRNFIASWHKQQVDKVVPPVVGSSQSSTDKVDANKLPVVIDDEEDDSYERAMNNVEQVMKAVMDDDMVDKNRNSPEELTKAPLNEVLGDRDGGRGDSNARVILERDRLSIDINPEDKFPDNAKNVLNVGYSLGNDKEVESKVNLEDSHKSDEYDADNDHQMRKHKGRIVEEPSSRGDVNARVILKRGRLLIEIDKDKIPVNDGNILKVACSLDNEKEVESKGDLEDSHKGGEYDADNDHQMRIHKGRIVEEPTPEKGNEDNKELQEITVDPSDPIIKAKVRKRNIFKFQNKPNRTKLSDSFEQKPEHHNNLESGEYFLENWRTTLLLSKKWMYIACVLVTLPLGTDKSGMWAIGAAGAMLISFLLVQPATTLVYAVYFKYVYEVGVELKRHRWQHKGNKDEQECNYFRLCRQSCYNQPIETVDEHERWTEKNVVGIKRLNDLRVGLARVALLLVLLFVFGQHSTMTYFSNNTMYHMLVEATYAPALIPLSRLTNYTWFLKYLEGTIVTALLDHPATHCRAPGARKDSSDHDTPGYTKKTPESRIEHPATSPQSTPAFDHTPMMDRAFAVDCNYKLLADIRLRQIRVKPGDSGKLFHAMDSDDYDVGWAHLLPGEHFLNLTKNIDIAPWTWRSDGWLEGYDVPSRMFPTSWSHSGGYSVHMGKSANNAREVLAFIDAFKWIDNRTRTIFVEFTVYNANVNVYSMTVIVVEVSTAGNYVPSYQVWSRQLRVWSWLALISGIGLGLCLLASLLCLKCYSTLFSWDSGIIWQASTIVLLTSSAIESHITSHMFSLMDSQPNMQYINFHSTSTVAAIKDFAAATTVALLLLEVYWKLLSTSERRRHWSLFYESPLFVASLSCMALAIALFFLLYKGSSDEGWGWAWGGWGVSHVGSIGADWGHQKYVVDAWQNILICFLGVWSLYVSTATMASSVILSSQLVPHPEIAHHAHSYLSSCLYQHMRNSRETEKMKRLVTRQLVSEETVNAMKVIATDVITIHNRALASTTIQ